LVRWICYRQFQRGIVYLDSTLIADLLTTYFRLARKPKNIISQSIYRVIQKDRLDHVVGRNFCLYTDNLFAQIGDSNDEC
jgi:hypothetical protein